ncbi:hypothetical protein TELCIR_18356, partial [Teladorsagia circumcincta]
SYEELLSSLKKIRHMSGTTKTGKAMLKALDMFKKVKHSDDVSRVAVVVTDGHSQDNPAPAADALRAAEIYLKENIANTLEEIYRATKRRRALGYYCGRYHIQSAKSRGFVVSSRAVLQFDRRFATANDHSFEIRCFYPDKSKTVKSPNRAQGVTTLVTEAVISGSREPSSEMAQAMKCRYVVTTQPDQCSSSAITVGTPLVHTWSCDQDHPRFRVHSCFISDPVSHRIEMLIDHHGCVTQSSIIDSLDYSTSGIVIATGKAVRFADVPILKFFCKIHFCNQSDAQCGPVEAPHCRTKRGTFDNVATPSKDAQYDVYDDDNIGEQMPEPEKATMAAMEEATTVSLPVLFRGRSRAAVIPLRSASSVVSSFPAGGVDFKLNTKPMAVVSSDHARDHFKKDPAVPKRALKVLHSKSLALKQVKGFVRHLPKPLTIQEMHRQLIESSSTEEPPAEAANTEATETREVIESSADQEATSEESVEPSIEITTDAPSPTTTMSTTAPTATTYEPVVDSVPDNEIEEEVVVFSDTIVIRLPHETFVTGCNRNAQC